MRPLAFFLPCALVAQSQGPALRVNAGANRHPISAYIYSINDYTDAATNPGGAQDLARALRIPLSRWGGDHTTRYNWKTDTYNSANDWYFENQPYPDSNVATLPDGSHFDHLMDSYTAAGTAMLASMPMLDWLPRRDQSCSFDVRAYGAQQKTDQWRSNCGNGVKPDGKTNITGNNPADTSYQVDTTDVQDWVRHLVARYGTAQQGGVRFWALDNEPVWWGAVHRDIYPQPQTYDDTLARGLRFAQAVKAVDPTALIHGPVTAGWWDLFLSNQDLVSGWGGPAPWKWYSNPVDRNRHGGMPFVPWYLQQMAQFEQVHGYRLLDVLDVHAYVIPGGIAFQPAGDAATQALRLDSTRVLWDPGYSLPDPNGDYYGQPVQLIPRLRQWVTQYYPGTKIAITEYNWGALDSINGALAQADVLGIFGREGVDLASIWSPPRIADPGAFAFRMFLDYDGAGGRFGETSIAASSDDQGRLAIYAAQRSDQALTILVVNKTGTDLASSIDLGGFAAAGMARVYQYSGSDLSRIARGADLALSGAAVAATFPAQSLTLLVVPAADSAFAVPQPAPAAVVNAASYTATIAPGAIVSVFGANLGPKTAVLSPALLNADMVDTQLAGVRVLFDGIPAPVTAVTEGQVNCVVPYAAANRPTVHVQVENQGRRSAALAVPVAATAPAIFALDASGRGQGAILNAASQWFLQVNGPTTPAPRGSVISVYMTGEGVTAPAGVDGRIATSEYGKLNVYPRPVAPVSAKIGGLDAVVQYAGAAPTNITGLMQVNVVVPDGLAPGNQPIQVTVGGATSQPGITVSVQ